MEPANFTFLKYCFFKHVFTMYRCFCQTARFRCSLWEQHVANYHSLCQYQLLICLIMVRCSCVAFLRNVALLITATECEVSKIAVSKFTCISSIVWNDFFVHVCGPKDVFRNMLGSIHACVENTKYCFIQCFIIYYAWALRTAMAILVFQDPFA